MIIPQWFIATPSNHTLVLHKLLFICSWTMVLSLISLARCFPRMMVPMKRLRTRVLSELSKTFLKHRKPMTLLMLPYCDGVFALITLSNSILLLTISPGGAPIPLVSQIPAMTRDSTGLALPGPASGWKVTAYAQLI